MSDGSKFSVRGIINSPLYKNLALMLFTLNTLQLVLYIALLLLAGQGLLWLIAGAKSGNNLFYQLFQVVNKPWVRAARWISPKQIANHQVPVVAFCVVGVLYVAVTLAKIEHCIAVAMQGCK